MTDDIHPEQIGRDLYSKGIEAAKDECLSIIIEMMNHKLKVAQEWSADMKYPDVSPNYNQASGAASALAAVAEMIRIRMREVK